MPLPTGSMIGFFLPLDIGGSVARSIPSGVTPEEGFHITFLFLGDTDKSQFDPIRKAVAQVAGSFSELSGTIGGSGRFPASGSSDEKDVLIRLVDVPRLEALRELLVAALRDNGIEPVLTHGYTPHVTMAYVDTGSEFVSSHPEPIPLTIDRLVFAAGLKREDFMLSGDEVLKSQLDFYHGFSIGDEQQSPEVSFKVDKIEKLDHSEQLVFGWASVVEAGGEVITDRQDDQLLEDTLESAVYDYVLQSRVGGEMHLRDGPRAKQVGRLVESIVFTKEKQEKLNIDLGFVGWWVGFKVDDSEVWKGIESGEFKGFSIHGTARSVFV